MWASKIQFAQGNQKTPNQKEAKEGRNVYSSSCHDDLTNIDVLESNVMKGEQEVSLLITSINLIALETVD